MLCVDVYVGAIFHFIEGFKSHCRLKLEFGWVVGLCDVMPSNLIVVRVDISISISLGFQKFSENSLLLDSRAVCREKKLVERAKVGHGSL